MTAVACYKEPTSLQLSVCLSVCLSSGQFSVINRVDNINCQGDEGLMLEMSAFKLFTVPSIHCQFS